MFKISNYGNALIFAILTISISVSGMAGSAFAATTQATQKHSHRHPAKDKRRLKQNKPIKKAAHQGKTSAKLQQKGRQINQEERAMAALNGGDTSKPVQNQQDNSTSAQIAK